MIDGVSYCTVDARSRTVLFPDSEKVLGVENDEKTRRVGFRVPKLCDGIDLSGFSAYINYTTPAGLKDRYEVADKAVSGDWIEFTWTTARQVYAKRGDVSFVVCLVKKENGSVVGEWHSAVATMRVLPGIEATVQTGGAVSADTVETLAGLIESCRTATAAANAAAASVTAAMTAEY